MEGINLGLFDYDRHNTLYYFILNGDEQIYLRYGGRDPYSPDSYLNLESIELALQKGLETHEKYKRGELPKPVPPKPLFARDMPLLVERTIGRGACVECHLIGDFQNTQREKDGNFDELARMRWMYRSPDIKTIGIHLDVPKGLLVAEAKSAAAEAGMKAGDLIAGINGTSVLTYADFQYQYDQVGRLAKQVEITVEREDKPVQLAIKPPVRWWWTDLGHRQWTVEPRIYFRSRPLSADEKRERGLKPDGFAGEVTSVDSYAKIMAAHTLQIGDIIFAVDGAEADPIANTPELYINLHKIAGETFQLGLIRDGERMKMPLKSARLSFRK
jgi:hypothetical protein